MKLDISDALDESSIRACFDVMVQLRDACRREAFVEQVQRQREAGYNLTYAREIAREFGGEAGRESGRVVAVSGWRIRETLAMGRHLYVEDLVVDEAARSGGCGAQMIEHLRARAAEEGCAAMLLDSGVQRYAAHRFYLQQRFDIRAYLFVRTV